MIRLFVLFTLAAATMADDSEDNMLLTTATNQLTARMFSEVAKSKPDKSFVLSAFSVLSPLAQLALASVGASHDELLKGIGMPSDNATKAVFSKLNTKLKSSKAIDLRMANKIYIAESYELNKDFAALSRDVFKSDVKNLNFLKSDESAAEINSWVEDQTNHRIKNLVSPSMLTSDTRAVLVNAIYFKGAWKYPFNKDLTKDEDFHVSKEKVIKVPTMYAKNDYKYVDSKELNAQVIEIPYAGEEASMMIILPKEIDGIKELEKKLQDPSVLDNVSKNMRETEVELYIPKFKIETTTNLKDILQRMQIKKLFTNDAQLNNLLKEEKNLFISDAIQKAFIEVNEEGAEAAAANGKVNRVQVKTDEAFGIVATSLLINPEPTPIFKADRPFYYAIKMNSLTLFNGIKSDNDAI